MPTLVLLWVWCCAYLNCAGWVLSAIHQLNAGGYTVVLALGLAALVCWRRSTSREFFPEIRWSKYRRRFRRPFPLAFLILAALAFLGGACGRRQITTRWPIGFQEFCTGWRRANGTGFTRFFHD